MAGIDLGIEGLSDAEPVGSGGNAVVYRAYESDQGRWVAVKVLRGLADDDALRRFDRERRAMGRLSQHEGIVTIHYSGTSARGEPYLVMPLLERGSLQDRIDRQGPVPWPEAVAMMTTVARTMEAAHQQDVIHRDLKPGNIMVSQTGQPLVADFGIAKHTGASASIQSSAITLTPAFSPPETIDGAPPTKSADVYALGATLFALINGSPPFTTGTDEAMVAVLMRVTQQPVRDLRPDGVPDAVCRVIEAAMAKAPDDRPASAGAVADMLERALAGGADPTRPADVAGAGRAAAADPLSTGVVPESSDPAPPRFAAVVGDPDATEQAPLVPTVGAGAATGAVAVRRRSRVGVLVALVVFLGAIGAASAYVVTSSGGDESQVDTASPAPVPIAPSGVADFVTSTTDATTTTTERVTTTTTIATSTVPTTTEISTPPTTRQRRFSTLGTPVTTAPPPPPSTEAACGYLDAGDGSPITAALGSTFTDTNGNTWLVDEGCALTFVEGPDEPDDTGTDTGDDDLCGYADAGTGEPIAAAVGTTFTDSNANTWLVNPDCSLTNANPPDEPDTTCGYLDAGDGSPITAEKGTTFTDSNGNRWLVGDDCTLANANPPDETTTCGYADAGTGEPISADVGTTFTDSNANTWLVNPDCSLTYYGDTGP